MPGRILKAGGRLGMGGDYGFAWNPHGDYAKELTFFVKYVGFYAAGSDHAAPRRTGAEIMGRGDEFGTLEAGKLADVLVVDGDVVADISVLGRPLAIHRRDAGRHRQGGPDVGRSHHWRLMIGLFVESKWNGFRLNCVVLMKM